MPVGQLARLVAGGSSAEQLPAAGRQPPGAQVALVGQSQPCAHPRWACRRHGCLSAASASLLLLVRFAQLGRAGGCHSARPFCRRARWLSCCSLLLALSLLLAAVTMRAAGRSAQPSTHSGT